jgi:nucleotide-binding universal stress UspA family protein
MLPLDGSRFSELALPLAIRLANQSGARLHIVRVHVPSLTAGDAIVSENYDELVRDWEREALSVALDRATDAGVRATGELLEGPVVEGLQRYIEAAGIDLVVMTTHGRSGIKRAVMGSVAEQCVRKTDIPILLIHPRSDMDEVATDLANVKRILVPLDGTEESEAVLPHVISLARLAGAELVLARVAFAPFDIAVTVGAKALTDYLERMRAEGEQYLGEIQAAMPADLVISRTSLTAERAPDGILRAAQAEGADMIAMATHGRSGWSRIAVGSVAETVLHKATTPVLLIKGAATARISADPHSMRSEPAHSGG